MFAVFFQHGWTIRAGTGSARQYQQFMVLFFACFPHPIYHPRIALALPPRRDEDPARHVLRKVDQHHGKKKTPFKPGHRTPSFVAIVREFDQR